MPTTAPFHIFGMPLFVDYVTTFDDKAETVTFVLSAGSNKIEIKEGTTP